MAGHIVVVGSLNMDMVVRTPHLPNTGETVIGSDFRNYPGGKGANQAVAAARLGAQVKLVGRVGADSFGDILLDTLAQAGVDTTHVVQLENEASGVAFITVDDGGQNTIVVASGANGSLSPEDVSAAEAAFSNASVLLVQLECPLAAVERAIQLAKRHGAKVVLNPAPAQLLDASLLKRVDYLIPNQTELALLAGQDSIQSAVQVLREHGVGRLVVTMGSEGALVVDGEFHRKIPTYPVQVVDTTAAGDAFAGAFAVGLTEGLSTTQATLWGNAAGALAVTRPGAQPSLPTRGEFDSFLENQKTA